MRKEHIHPIFHQLYIQVLRTAYKCGMGVAYIKGQLDEACHQLAMAIRKQSKDDDHGL